MSQERACCGRDAPHPSRLRRATFPPVGGRLSAYSNRVELLPLWDVWIHILGIRAECACWGAGGRKGRPYDESQSISRNGGRGKPLPYGFPEMTLELGRGAPWVSRRGIRIRPAGGPGVPPLRSEGNLYGGRVRTPAPTAEFFWGGNGGRTMCAPTGEGAGTCPSSAPVCVPGHLSLSPLPLRDIIPTPFGLWPFPPDRGNRPLDKGSRPPGGRA